MYGKEHLNWSSEEVKVARKLLVIESELEIDFLYRVVLERPSGITKFAEYSEP